MRTTKEIDQDITKTEKTRFKLEVDRAKNAGLIETAQAIRSKDSFAALSRDDPAALDRLTKARASCWEIEPLLEDIDSALSAADQQLANLRIVRDESYRAEKWAEFQKMRKESLDSAMGIDAMVVSLGSLLQEHLSQLRQMSALSTEARKPKIFGLKHVCRVINSQFHKILPHEFPSQNAFYRDRTWEEILRDQIDGTGDQSKDVKRVA